MVSGFSGRILSHEFILREKKLSDKHQRTNALQAHLGNILFTH